MDNPEYREGLDDLASHYKSISRCLEKTWNAKDL